MVDKTLLTGKGDSLSKLRELLNQGIDLNTKDINGRTLLHHAVNNNEREAVKCLLENGADALVTDNETNTALHNAVTNNDNAMVNVILKNVVRDKVKTLLDAEIKNTKTAALHLAAKFNNYVIVKTLLRYGANFEITDKAGKKAVDLTSREDLRELLQVIDASFSKATVGDVQILADFERINCKDFPSLFNCRNNNGHTIIQKLIVNEHYNVITHMIGYRCGHPTEGFLLFGDPNRKKEVDSLITVTRDCRDFWTEKRNVIMAISADIEKCGLQEFRIIAEQGGKIACEALEKVHEMFLTYRKFEGKKKTLTTNPAMKTLEEVLEVLGFDPEQIFVLVGEDASYYQKIPSNFKANIGSLINLMNCIVDASIFYLQRTIYTIQIINAVKTNNIGEIRSLLEKGGTVRGIDRHHETALSYAVEQGNEEIIQLLLKSGAEVACDGAISPIFPAIDNGNAKILKLLLNNVVASEMVDLIDLREKSGGTALHKAAQEGRLNLVKILMSYGATYCFFDAERRTPLDVSTNEDVSAFLKIVDVCFHDAKEGDVELIHKLKAMETDEFMAIAGTKNLEGHTLADVAAKANAKNIAVMILRMIKEAKEGEK